MKISKILAILGSEFTALYAFWVFRLVDCLGYGGIACRLRAVILRLAGFKIGSGCVIRPGVYIHCLNAPVKIGKGVSMNQNIYFDAPNPVTIGNFVNVGHGTKFANSAHQLVSNFKTRRPSLSLPPIVVEDYVWLGCNVLILGGVTIGTGSVIGAGSVVTKSIPPHSFAAGVPAKVIRLLEQPTVAEATP
jgi:acetyltransferase-like isoleucine patch superfamily enzyme